MILAHDPYVFSRVYIKSICTTCYQKLIKEQRDVIEKECRGEKRGGERGERKEMAKFVPS